MLPSPEHGLSGRLQALHQLVKDPELWPLVLVSYMCLSIHIVIKVSTQKQRVYEFASLRTLRRARKRAWSFRVRGRKCRRVLANSLYGMAAAATNLKASRRRSCHLRFGLVPVLPWQVLVSNSVGAPRAPTLGQRYPRLEMRIFKTISEGLRPGRMKQALIIVLLMTHRDL